MWAYRGNWKNLGSIKTNKMKLIISGHTQSYTVWSGSGFGLYGWYRASCDKEGGFQEMWAA
jgi:hypothetical protein